VDMINMQEEAGEWKNSYDSLQAEGRELFQTYERKCTALKQATIQVNASLPRNLLQIWTLNDGKCTALRKALAIHDKQKNPKDSSG